MVKALEKVTSNQSREVMHTEDSKNRKRRASPAEEGVVKRVLVGLAGRVGLQGLHVVRGV